MLMVLVVHLSIFLRDISINLLKMRGLKVPVACGEELQHFQTHRYFSLHSNHAGKKGQTNKLERNIPLRHVNSQTPLSEYGQEEIDEIGGQPHEHDGTEGVIDLACGHVAIRVPKPHFEGVFHGQVTANIHNPFPGAFLGIINCYIVDGYLRGSTNKKNSI